MRDANENVKELFCELQNSNSSTAKSERLTENVRVYGNPPAQDNISVRNMLAIEQLLGVRVSKCWHYNRFIVNGILYHSDSNRLQKRNNSIVELRDGMLCKIKSLVAFRPRCTHGNVTTCACMRMCCVLVKELVKTRRQMCRDIQLNISSSFVHEISESDNIIAVHAQSFNRKCVLIELRDNAFVIPLPNNVERD